MSILFAYASAPSFLQILATMLAGIGLFLLGLRVLSMNINKLAGFAFQRFSASITSGVGVSIFWGLLAGFVTQSARTLSVLFASLARGGIMAPTASFVFLCWANLGCLFILFAIVFPFKTMAFLFMGLSGFLYSIGKPLKFARIYSIMIGVALALFGLSVISEYSNVIVDFPQMRELFEMANENPLCALIAGFLLVIMTQSFPAMTLIVISLSGSVLHWDTAMNLAIGVHLGSSINAYFVGFDFKGRARQCIFCVFYYYVTLAILTYAIWIAFDLVSPTPLSEIMPRIFESQAKAVAVGILSANLITAITLTLLRKQYAQLIEKFSPELKNEHSGRPKFIALTSLNNPPLALDLATSEHMRLMRRLPSFLTLLRYRNFVALAEEGIAFGSVRNRLHDYLDEIVKRADNTDLMERTISLKQRDDSSALIIATLMTLSEKLANTKFGNASWIIIDKVFELSEDILAHFEASIEYPTKENLEAFLNRNKDFEAQTAELQNDFVKNENSIPIYERGNLLRITGIYERFAWLLYRYAVAMHNQK